MKTTADRRLPLASLLGPALIAVALGAAGCNGSVTGLDASIQDSGALACTNDDGCPADSHCDDATHVCVPGTGNACVATSSTSSTSACGPGRTCHVVTGCGATRCHGNSCVPKTCTANSDCGGWLCEAGTCTAPPACTPGAAPPCPTGSVCDAASMHCKPATACMRDRDCMMMGQICTGGYCIPQQDCTMTSMCPADQRCNGGVCRAPCMVDGDCGAPAQRWKCDAMSGECTARCLGDGTCPMNQICEMNLCAPEQCSDNSMCTAGPNMECQGGAMGHGRCVTFVPCVTGGPNTCPVNQTCNAMGHCTELPTCVSDRNCAANEFCDNGHCQPSHSCNTMITCTSTESCVGGRCVPGPCRSSADCTMAGQICLSGVCQLPPPPTLVTEVKIITPAGVVRPGTTYRFAAVALNQSGQVVPGVTFHWISGTTAVATIDPSSGLATGAASAGHTAITASVDTGTMTVSSAPVDLTNLGPLPANTLRVTVAAAASGAAISGATVLVTTSTGGDRIGATDMNGVASFAGVTGAQVRQLTVAHTAYDYLTVIGTLGNDVLIPLPSITRSDRVGGLKGSVDLSATSTSGAVGFSLSGGSFISPLFGATALDLFGTDVFTVTVPNPAGGNLMIPVPASATLEVTFAGNPFSLKDTYYARVAPGLRAAWSFGGRVSQNAFGGGLGGGMAGGLLGTLLPYFQRFDHAVRPAISVVALPTVVDSGDINGNGNRTELLPDYTNFPSVTLRPDTAQTLRYFVDLANVRLPAVSGGNANAVILIAGTVLPGLGFVPLGLDGVQDQAGSGFVNGFSTKLAPAHGGLEIGEYAVLAMAVRLAAGQMGLPGPGSTRLMISSALPTTVDFSSGFIDSPRGATYHSMTRVLDAPGAPAGALRHLMLSGTDGSWHVFTTQAGAMLNVPAAPMGSVDRALSSTGWLDVVQLNGSDLPTVFGVGGGFGTLDHATSGFARGDLTVQ